MNENNDSLPKDVEEELEKSRRRGEEAIGERSTPQHDIRAAIVIGLFCIWAIAVAAQMEVPTGNFLTAPAMLPIVTAATMLLMVIGLGISAWRRAGKDAFKKTDFGEVAHEFPRAFLVMGIVLVYIVAVDFINFEFRLRLLDNALILAFSSFETITIITLTLILRMFWKRPEPDNTPTPLLKCFTVSLLFTLALANVFRYAFLTPMPGTY